MSNTLKFGNGQWGTKVGSALAYNDLDGNFKPLPFDFTRSTSGTRINKGGLIEVVTNNKPRIDFSNDAKGAFLLEPERSNLVQYSEDFTQSAWIKGRSSVLSDLIISPNGTQNADKLTENTDTGTHELVNVQTVVSGSNYSLSVFIKSGSRTKASLVLAGTAFSSGGNGQVLYDLSNGTIISTSGGATSSIEDYGNGWYRCSINKVSANTSGVVALGLVDDNNNISYQGNGTSGIYFYGAQLEQGSYATSYIPTQGSVVTRNQDFCSNENLNVDYSGDYTLYLEHETLSLTEYNQFQFRQETSISYIFRVGNSLNIGTNLYTAANTIGFNKFALSVTSIGSYKFYKNGVLLSSGSGLNANLETLKSDALGMNIKEIKLYNNALTDQELINLTTI